MLFISHGFPKKVNVFPKNDEKGGIKE